MTYCLLFVVVMCYTSVGVISVVIANDVGVAIGV